MKGLRKLINAAQQQDALKRVEITNHKIPDNARLLAKREEETAKRIAELNVTELVEERTATSRKFKPKG